MNYGIKYYTVKTRDDFPRVKFNIEREQGFKNLSPMEILSLAGNHEIAQFMNHATKTVIKIDGPGIILREFIKFLGE